MPVPPPIFQILLGAVLLLFGRRLFWIYISVLGFLLGLEATQQYLNIDNPWLPIVIGFGVGVVCAMLAVLLQYTAIGLAGFIGGAYLAMNVLGIVSMEQAEPANLLIVLGAGAIGLVLFLFIFDPALVILSSITGAALVSQALVLDQQQTGLVLVGLSILGAVFQFFVLSRSEKPGGSR